MKTKCKDCGESRIRVRSNRRRQVNRFYYVDGTGRLWNGRQCPDCKNPSKHLSTEKPTRNPVHIDFNEDFLYVA